MPDIVDITASVHLHFEVPVTVDDEDSAAVLHLGVEIWGGDGVTMTRADLISFRVDADALPSRGSVIVCSDTSAVPTTRTWVITDRAQWGGGDDHIQTWHMRKSNG